MEHIFGLSKPISSISFFTSVSIEAEFDHLFKNVALNGTELFNGPHVWCFWRILLPWDAKNTICLALIGYFSQNMGLIHGRSLFSNFFFPIFCIFRNFCSKLFWKYLKNGWFSGKSYENMFCRKFTQLSGKLSIVKISLLLPALCLKKSVSFFCASVSTYYKNTLKLTMPILHGVKLWQS